MAVTDCFLKIDGIEGESTDPGHRNEIPVTAFAWEESQSGGSSGGGGGGAGKVVMGNLHAVINVSKASPKLFLACASGQHLKTAVLSCRRSGGQQQDFLRWKLTDVVVSSYKTSVTAGEGDVVDAISFGFAQIQVEYQPKMPDGSLGAPVKAGWDLKTNQKV